MCVCVCVCVNFQAKVKGVKTLIIRKGKKPEKASSCILTRSEFEHMVDFS